MAKKLDETLLFGTQLEDLTEEQKARSVLVSGIPRFTSENGLMQSLVRRHFEWVRNGGGKIDRIHFRDYETAVITYRESGVVKKVLSLRHTLGGTYLKVYEYSQEAVDQLASGRRGRVGVRSLNKVPQDSTPGKGKRTSGKSASEQNLRRLDKQVRMAIGDKPVKDTREELYSNEQLNEILDYKKRLREEKEQELKAMEDILFQVLEEEKRQIASDTQERSTDELQKELENERQARTAVNEELNKERITATKLKETLRQEQQEKRAISEELTQARTRLRQLRQEKTCSEERLRDLENQMTELQGNEGDMNWIIPRDKIELSPNVLGEGSYGKVVVGNFRGSQVAVKDLHQLILSDYHIRLFKREMRMASRCRHPNLLQFIGAACIENASPLIVYELLDKSLYALLEERPLEETEMFRLSLDIAKGLNYLHLHEPKAIIHRDVKSANVLLWMRGDVSWRAKLSDYGSVNFTSESGTERPGTAVYAAPECSQTPKMDVFSLGVLLCEMSIGERPNPGDRRNQISRVGNRALRTLIRGCVDRTPDNRPPVNEVVLKLNSISQPSVFKRGLQRFFPKRQEANNYQPDENREPIASTSAAMSMAGEWPEDSL